MYPVNSQCYCCGSWWYQPEELINSGSVSNLISQESLQKLEHKGLKPELQPCNKKLYVNGGQELEVVSQFKSELS